jgi:transcriptional regulator with XRE-family HTH domain
MNEDAVDRLSTARQVAIGQRLRELRLAREMSIGDLASRAVVSAGIISQIERGQANPSLKTLERIRTALGVNLWALLEPTKQQSNGDPGFVRRAADRVKITVGSHRLLKELLSPSSELNLRFMVITFPPLVRNTEVVLGVGEKAGLVLDGQVTLTIGDETALLNTGDSFQFDSSLPHQVVNPAEQEARVLWIMSMTAASM